MKKIDLDIDWIIKKFKGGWSATKIGKNLKVSRPVVIRALKKIGLKLKSKSNGKKITISDSDVELIYEQYLNKKKSIKVIAKAMNLSQTTIRKILAKKGVTFRSRSEANSLIQKGSRRSIAARRRMKRAQRKYAKSGKRKQTGGVCKFFILSGWTCQGTYEQYYIENIADLSEVKNATAIKTPYGIYTPDFETKEFLIEIKSEYTYQVLLGLKAFRKGMRRNTKQYQKIVWISRNLKPVKIFVIKDKKERIYSEIILN